MYISGLIPMGPSVLESAHACHLPYDLVFQGDLPAPFRACSRGLQSPKAQGVVPSTLTLTHTEAIIFILFPRIRPRAHPGRRTYFRSVSLHSSAAPGTSGGRSRESGSRVWGGLGAYISEQFQFQIQLWLFPLGPPASEG